MILGKIWRRIAIPKGLVRKERIWSSPLFTCLTEQRIESLADQVTQGDSALLSKLLRSKFEGGGKHDRRSLHDDLTVL